MTERGYSLIEVLAVVALVIGIVLWSADADLAPLGGVQRTASVDSSQAPAQ